MIRLLNPKNLGVTAGLGAVGIAIAMGAVPTAAAGGPSGWLILDGHARNAITSAPSPYDWGNHGTAYDNTACSNAGINAADAAGSLGSGGIFNCGKEPTASGTNTNPVPFGPSLTQAALADSSIVASAFLVDPLFNSNNKNTGLTCPVTGASTTAGDPTALTTGASKNDLPLSGFVYTPTSFQPKDDLGNVYAVAHRATGVNEVFFGAERVVNNGASHVDFEFLQSTVTLVPSGTTGSAACSGNFAGHRTGGDFLAAVDFANGGALGGFTIYEWSCGGTAATISEGTVCDPGSPGFANAQYIVAPAAVAAAFNLTVNADGSIPCGGWVCRGQAKGDDIHTMAKNEFMEGGVNLDTLGFSGCVSTFLPHTRSSPDINSTLQDFAGPVGLNTCSITTTPAASVTDIRSGGLTDTATVSGFVGTPGKVDFKLYGPFASAGAISAASCTNAKLAFDSGQVSTQDSASPANYSATSGAPPGVGYYQWVASYTSPNGGAGVSGNCADPSEQVLVVDANIQISPPTATNEIGANHVLTVHVNVSSGNTYVNAPANTTITFAVTNSNGATATPASGSCQTVGTTGSCQFTINSPTAGQTSVSASTSVVVGGLTLLRTTDGTLGDSGPAAKTWVDANINITPLTATNEIKANHQLAATVLVNNGSGAGYVNAPNNTSVTFSLTNSNGATATFVGSPTCLTSAGKCSVIINSPTPGSVTISATTNVTVGGLILTRTTGDTHTRDGSNAIKTYVDANINITPLTAVNEVNAIHTVTATVLVNDGSGAGYVAAPDMTTVSWTATGSGGANPLPASGTCKTAAGMCSFSFSSASAGQVDINATVSISVGGVSLTRSTGDTHTGDGPDANKFFVDASISIQATAVNEVNNEHVFTVTVTAIPGGAGPVTFNSITTSVTPVPGTLSSTCGSPTVNGNVATCTVTINSTTAGTFTANAAAVVTMGGQTVHRSTDGSAGPAGPGGSGPASKTYVDASVSIGPSAVNEVGHAHIFTITVTAIPGGASPVSFGTITPGVLPAPGTLTSDCNKPTINGLVATCSLTINSTTAGSFTANVSADMTMGGVTVTRSTSGNAGPGGSGPATKTYVDASIAISPSSINEVNHEHVFTITVTAIPSVATPVVFNSITPSVNPAPGTFTSTCNSPTINGNVATCTVTINNPTNGTFTLNAAAVVTMGGTAVDRSTDGSAGPAGPGGTGPSTKTFVDASISISPSSVNEVNNQHVFTITVTAYPSGAAPVVFNSISPSVLPAPGTFTTTCGSPTVNGNVATCTVTINNPTAGTFTLNATADVTMGGVTVHRDTAGNSGPGGSGPSTKTFVDASITIGPSKVNEVGSPHVFTITVTAFPAGASVTFGSISPTVVPAPGTLVSTCGSPTINANVATCTVTINSTSAGTFTANATADVTIDGVTVHRDTAANSGPGGSGPATKIYVDASVQIAASKVNEVGHQHIFTITVTAIPSTAQPVSFDSITTNVNPAPTTESTTCGSPTVNGNVATCTLTINSSSTGVFTANVSAHVTMGGITVHRSTDGSDGPAGPGGSGPATKTYVDAYITLHLDNTPDLVGTNENVTASVFTDDGSGAGFQPANGAVVHLNIVNPSVGNFVPSGLTAQCTTGASGTCVVQITSNVVGTTTVHATTTVTVNTVSLVRATGDGVSKDGADIVKTWIPYTPALSTTKSADGTIGSATISDTANVTGAFGQAGSSDVVTFKLYGPFNSAGSVSCAGNPVFTDGPDTLAGGTAGQPNQSWSVSTSSAFTPTLAGYYAWQVTANFSGDQANTDPTPNPTACTSEVVHISPVNPTLTTAQSSPASILINTPATISDKGTLSGFVNLQSGDTMTFNLYGPTSTSNPVCNNTNLVLGPITGNVDTTTGVATTGPQSFTPTQPGTYYWVASFSGDVNNTTLNATNVGCGDSKEAVTVTAPSAQITPTGTTCAQFSGGTATTLTQFNYPGPTTIGSGVNPGVFFYYEKVTIGANATITVNETITSGQSNAYLLQVLNSSTSQINVYDAACNTINTATESIGPTGTSPYVVTISGLPAGTYIISVKYTPKTIVGLAVPTPSTINYSFSTAVNGSTVASSTQGISGIKQ